MKLEIEVELPEHIVAEWDAVAVRRAKADEWIAVPHGDGMVAMRCAIDAMTPAIILRRKLNPSDWWPRWILADKITLEKNGAIGFHANNVNSEYWNDDAAYSVFDFSWIPENLRRSGATIQNPWKGEQQ